MESILIFVQVKIRKMKFLLLVFVCIQTVACQLNKAINSPKSEKETEVLTGLRNPLKGKWVLDYMSPVGGKDFKKLFQIQKPYLTFVDEIKVAGNNGCNNIAGEYSATDNIIHFDTSRFRSTKMYCEGFDETAFIGVLKTINGFGIINDGKKLILLTGDIVSMSFVKIEE